MTATGPGSIPAPLRDYLDRLDVAARGLTVTDRQDLRARVWLKVAESAGPAPADESLIRVLDDLGPPEGLVPAPPPGGARALRDPVVAHLLGCSLLTLGITGVLGLVRVWRSVRWSARDALLATLLVVVGGTILPLVAPVQPVAGALLGGLGVGAPLAGLLLGVMLVAERRSYRRRLRPTPWEEHS